MKLLTQPCLSILMIFGLMGAVGCRPEAKQQAATGAPNAEAIATPADQSHPVAHPVAHLERGIDVSSHSGNVDWALISEAGYGFGIVKASEGVDLPDPDHDTFWKALTDAGLVRGAYHFYVTEDDPEDQARLFIQSAKLEPGDLPPIVDIERIGKGTKPGLADRLQRCLDILEEHYGVTPIIYTSPNFWNAHLPATFGKYPLWIGEYGVESPQLPHGWDKWHFWQFAGDAAVEGVEKGADLSRGHPDPEVVKQLLIPSRS